MEQILEIIEKYSGGKCFYSDRYTLDHFLPPEYQDKDEQFKTDKRALDFWAGFSAIKPFCARAPLTRTKKNSCGTWPCLTKQNQSAVAKTCGGFAAYVKEQFRLSFVAVRLSFIQKLYRFAFIKTILGNSLPKKRREL